MVKPDYSYEINIHPSSDRCISISCDATSLKNTILRLAELTGGKVAKMKWRSKHNNYVACEHEPFVELGFDFECDIEYYSANHAEFAMHYFNKKLHEMSNLEMLLELECKKTK